MGLFGRKPSVEKQINQHLSAAFTFRMQGNVAGAIANYVYAADQLGSTEAMCSLGMLADEGGDREAAKTYFERAIAGGDASGMFHLGLLYHSEALRSGDQDAQAWEDAWELLVKAHRAGCTYAYRHIRATEYPKPPYPKWWGQRDK